MRLLQLLVILATAFTAQSQGVIRGKINDGHTGESLIGANAYLEGTTKGAMADLDGNFSLEGLAQAPTMLLDGSLDTAPSSKKW